MAAEDRSKRFLAEPSHREAVAEDDQWRVDMTLEEYRRIAAALNRDLADTFAKHGLKMGKLSATVDAHVGTIKYGITVADTNLKDSGGNTTTPEALRYQQYATLYGMDGAWLGKDFRMGGKTFTLVGLRGGRTQKCVLARASHDGKNYIFHPDAVRGAMLLADASRKVETA